jgi:hypothetical protein
MLGKSATGPAYLPALHTDPGAARGGRHGGEVGSEGREEAGRRLEAKVGSLKNVTCMKCDAEPTRLMLAVLSRNSHQR